MTKTTGREVRLSKRKLFAMLNYVPHPGQLEVHRSRAPRRIVACGVRFGKTILASMEGIAAAMEPRERSIGWVCAPTYDLADRVFREIQLIALTHLRHRIILMREHDRRLLLRNMGGGVSELRAKSADNPVSLLGEGLDWLVVDEASRLKPRIWQEHLSQRLIDKKGWALLISTPNGQGYFYELYRRGQGDDPSYESWNYPSWKNPRLDAKLIEAERQRLPERVFNQEYGAQFVEGAGAVFRNVMGCATGDWKKPIRDAGYWAGLDLARLEDYSVLVIMDSGNNVVYCDRFTRLDWNLQVSRVQAACAKYNNAKILLDSTGVGDPILQAFRREGCRVEGYQFTAASKSKLINNLVLMLESNSVTLPRPGLWDEGLAELEAFQYSVTNSGNVRSGAPSSLHDDCVIALALAAWQRRPGRKRLRFGTFDLRTGEAEWEYLSDD